MTYRRLFLFVEGDDDERFFSSVVLPTLYTAYDNVQFVQFSALKKEKLKGFLRSVAAMKADYILESFDRKAAVGRNESFRRFLRKFVPPGSGF